MGKGGDTREKFSGHADSQPECPLRRISSGCVMITEYGVYNV